MGRRLLEDAPFVIVNGLSLALRRRQDGFARVEVSVYSGAHLRLDGFGGGRFVLYLNDDDRRKLAAAIWPGLGAPTDDVN
jgi:hypothetical protein